MNIISVKDVSGNIIALFDKSEFKSLKLLKPRDDNSAVITFKKKGSLTLPANTDILKLFKTLDT